ncbi:pyridoxamine 5'-phosphate oxidase family protein [Clostridium sp. WLY-B-L2]|uniref:Pyridoxamine 5'-phosphate oxidase family protein n=1 Tax=Clostridium aromativorans TaxID=2836848 RepID=A0ABS8N5Q3_9CLOT|nr:pyridoxamine 5'-phosphate oxidase family protein [Clostridium aromativorans]MCC9295129.1 pyridoxamine 5'-phosphate oxidase family protein [Clostridium aromativorans]
MKNLNENVISLLNNQLWYIGTYSDEPNTIPVLFKEITSEGKLVIGDVFLRRTLENINKNGKIAISACDATTMEGYQIKGTAIHLTEGELVDKFKKIVSKAMNNAVTAKGVLIVTPEQVIVATPGADNNKEL